MIKKKLGRRFSDQACTNKSCRNFAVPGLGNIIGNGTYQIQDGIVRKFFCRTCKKSFCDRTRTAFYDLRTKDKIFYDALTLIIKGKSIRSVANELDTTLDTVRSWLTRAASHPDDVNSTLSNRTGFEVEKLNELWSSVRAKRFSEWKRRDK